MSVVQRYCCAVLLFYTLTAASQGRKGLMLLVAADGSGNFRSIQEAINSLPDSSSEVRTISIKAGRYDEKIFIEKSNIALVGTDKNNVVITQSIARDAWRCDHKDDWGVATINLRGSDITLKNLTIENGYGFNAREEKIIPCAADSSHTKMVRPDGHQMALRTFQTTRLSVINCILKAFGGDTVSPWNVDSGMFYFKDCVMEGGVDFYCPRGWAYAENCSFVAHTGPASIWHDGSKYQDSKTVLKNCNFSGYDGFKLGRYHRDAQFYLLDCRFAENMADTDIYQVPTQNTIQWGRRVYYYNCHRSGGKDYKWFANNLSTAPGSPRDEQITPSWVFGDKWNLSE